MKKFIILFLGIFAFTFIQASPEKTANPGYSLEQLSDFEQISIASININTLAISDYNILTDSETLYNSIYMSDISTVYTDNLQFTIKTEVYGDLYSLNLTAYYNSQFDDTGKLSYNLTDYNQLKFLDNTSSFDLSKSRLILHNGYNFKANKKDKIRYHYKNYEDSGIYKSFDTQISSIASNIGYEKYIFLVLNPYTKNLKRTKNKFLS